MKMATLFKDFMTTYNRTYESREGRPQPCPHLSQADLGFSYHGTLILRR